MIARAKSVAARSRSCSKLLKPQSHWAYDQVTTYMPPKNVGIGGGGHRMNVRLVAEVMGDH